MTATLKLTESEWVLQDEELWVIVEVDGVEYSGILREAEDGR